MRVHYELRAGRPLDKDEVWIIAIRRKLDAGGGLAGSDYYGPDGEWHQILLGDEIEPFCRISGLFAHLFADSLAKTITDLEHAPDRPVETLHAALRSFAEAHNT